MRGRRLRVGIMACLMSVVLTGCVGLPETSAVSSGQAINGANDREAIAIEPNGPGAHDDPRQIVEGFMQAQISSDDDYAIAREFMTAAASHTWHPGESSTVFGSESQLSVTRPALNTMAASVPMFGTLDADGRLQRSADGAAASLKFGMSKTSAGWRISSLPPNFGVWISRDDFERAYTNVPVYYPARTGRTLVPDLRWLPKAGLTTALARASLSAPSPWLADAVSFPFPSGSALQIDSVPISNSGVADISLTSEVLSASVSQKTAIWAAMAATLGQGHGVNGINVTVHDKRLETDNLPAQVRTSSDVGFAVPPQSLSALIIRSKTFSAWANAVAVDARSGMSTDVAKGRAKLPAIPASWGQVVAGQGGRQIAAVSQDKTEVRRWLSGAELVSTRLGSNLRRPDFDTQGWLWVAGQVASSGAAESVSDTKTSSAPFVMWAIDTSKPASSTPLQVKAPWLHDAVTAFSLSPEGDRLALVTGTGTRARVLVCSILRGPSGAPMSLGSPLTLPAAVSDVQDVVWSDPLNLAVLGRYEGDEQPVLMSLDGAATGLGAVEGADSLESTWNGGDGLFIHTKSGNVYNRLGAAWNSFLTHGEVVVPSS